MGQLYDRISIDRDSYERINISRTDMRWNKREMGGMN